MPRDNRPRHSDEVSSICARAEQPNVDRGIRSVSRKPRAWNTLRRERAILLTWSSGCNLKAWRKRACEVIMLRVTVEERGDRVVFRVEGKLRGPWVIELERCWRSTTTHAKGKSFSVDLDGVTFVDDQGKALLTEMDTAGVELIANGWMMRSTVQQIAAHL